MIVRPRPRPHELFLLTKGSILPRIATQLIAVFFFSVVVVALEDRFPAAFHRLMPAPFTLLGIALSIFLGFRNNACYDRWWEARRQWGQLIVEMRSLARLATTLPATQAEASVSRRIVRHAIAFSYALAEHLKHNPLPAQLEQYLPAEEMDAVTHSKNPPEAILRAISRDCAHLLRSGEISDILFKAFDERVTAISGIHTACERIDSTPTPFTYTLLLHRTAYFFCGLLPFALVTTLGIATPIFCTLVAYTFFGLDALGDELEEPFGESQNALPLNALVRIIEINLLEALGETNLPPALLPIDYILC